MLRIMEYLKKQTVIELYNIIIIIYNTSITPTLNFFLELYIVTESGLFASIIDFIY